MSQVIERLSSVGITPVTPPQTAKRIRIANSLALLALVFCGVGLLVDVVLMKWAMALRTCGIAGAMGAFLALNHWGWTRTARFGLIVLLNGLTAVYCAMLGRDSGLHASFFALMGLPLILLEKTDRWAFWLGTLMSPLAYFGLHFGGELLLPRFPGLVSASKLQPFFALMLFAQAFGILWYFYNASEKTERALESAEKVARESAARLKGIITNVPGVVYRCACDEDWTMEFISEAIETLSGYTAADFIGNRVRAFASIIHPDDAMKVSQAVHEAIRWKMPFEMTYRIRHADGSIRWVHEKGQGAFNEEGKLLNLDGAIFNITEQKKAQDLILEQQVKLMAAAKMSALGEMASGIAHEINNPLAIIHGKATFLKTQVLQGEISPDFLLETSLGIESTAMRISKIVKSLRFFARDGDTTPFEQAQLKGIVDDTIELCQERFRNHAVELRLKPISEALTLECRAVQISQVLLNLLNNAFDAVETSVGERWIELAVQEVGNEIEIAVTDSGHGIPVEIREKIFRPFFSTKDVGKGTGLGLSVSKGIIENHYGSIQLDDASPQTRFVLRVPRIQGKWDGQDKIGAA